MKVVAFIPLLLLVTTTVVVAYLAREATNGPATPAIAAAAAIIAVTSVSVTALTSYANWVRVKRQCTLTAWSDWVENTHSDRSAISEAIGVNAGLTADQGQAICDGVAFTANNKDVDVDEAKEMRRQIRGVLAGLERLAVGVEQMIYDRDLLMEIGGTTVVTTHARYKTYITHIQEHPDEAKRRPLAYKALDALIFQVESEEGRARRHLFDEARLRRIEQTTGEKSML